MRPLYEALEIYIRQGRYPFHMLGHKGNRAFLPPAPLLSLDVAELEETETIIECLSLFRFFRKWYLRHGKRLCVRKRAK